MIKYARKINASKTLLTDYAEIKIEGVNLSINTGQIRAETIAKCVDEIMKKFARELVDDTTKLTGILKGKDLERYLDNLIKQHRGGKFNQN